ncbi:hypothetical protein CR105_23580 [Massilia eurypsychrophila]|jgi:hypothetical protein|uniref:DUF3304 domain-containing protein n=1 Tax=Massilia eurypsychrophila TaxID=1485217 RepID=A0A2G8T984_9BURK|nr:DUF3304 domain-containing protein [Massilia eurypsychrophila]PIL42591.1 hypothetical protein CR105_23580 [Massilia eurypsychrophila]
MRLELIGTHSKRALGIALVLSIISGCQPVEAPAEHAVGMGGIVGANYSDNGIQWFTVDGAGGMRLGTYTGGGGHVCCAIYPRTWTPNFRVKVQWARSDGRDASGTTWKIKQLERIVAVDKYVVEGNVYVLFFPDDEVKVFVSDVGIGNPNFPTRPGYPEDAKKERRAQ